MVPNNFFKNGDLAKNPSKLALTSVPSNSLGVTASWDEMLQVYRHRLCALFLVHPYGCRHLGASVRVPPSSTVLFPSGPTSPGVTNLALASRVPFSSL